MIGMKVHGRCALWMAVVVLILTNILTAGGSAGGGSDVSKLEIRGDVASGQYVWNAYNFAGLFYDFRAEKWTETLKVSSISGRDIPVDNLIYETRPVSRNYQVYNNKNIPVNGESSYYLVGWQGKNYVALKGKANKFVNLLLEHNPKPEDVKPLTVGERWDLRDGYSVITQSIAPFASPPTARLVLYKNGIEVKNETVQQGGVFNYTREIAGVTDVTVFATYLDKVYSDVLFLNYTWLISDNAIVIQAGDRFGKLRVTAAGDNEIILKNDAAMTLTKDSVNNIMGGLNFKVADNDNLRYYPFVELAAPGTYEIRGTAVNTTYTWNAHNFAGFFYDFKGDRMTETFNVSLITGNKVIPSGSMSYRTHTIPEEYRVFRNTGKLVNGKSTFSIIGWMGQKYVAFNDNASRLARFLVDYDGNKTFLQGESWNISEGYMLVADVIYPNNTVHMVLKRNGIIINSSVLSNQTVWVVNENIAGETAPVFVTHIDLIASDRIRINSIWLISGNVEIFGKGDKYGNLAVDTAGNSELILRNYADIMLSGESIIDIMDGLRFWVNHNVRYYPFVTVNVTGSPDPSTNNACASLCHNYYKRLDRSVDFYPNSFTSFNEYETFLGILNQMRDTPMNVTDPTIDFYYDPAELNGNSYDYFRKVQPSYQQFGHAFFEFQDMTLSNGNGTFGIDKGERTDTNGFDVARTVGNNGHITEDGYLNVTVSAVLYENVNNYIALSAGLWNTSEFKVWVANWTSSEPVDYQDIRPDNVFVHFGTQGDILPRRYDLNVTFYVDRIIPANITLKPWVSVNTRNNLQHNETHGSGVTINGTMFNMNSTFRSSNDNLTWIAEEGYEKRIELEGGITEILEPYAEFEFNKDLVVETRDDSLSSGSYEKNLQYSLNINNIEDSGKNILGDLNFGVQADNITDVGWRQYANWNRTSAKWSFPSVIVIKENEGHGTNIITSYYEPGYLNVDINRWMDQTVFNSEDYQLVKFNVTFKDKEFSGAWARIAANNQYGVDAFVVPGTFTNDNNAPGSSREWEHAVHFNFDKELIQTGVTYDFSVLLRVKPNGQRSSPIIYKPGIVIGEGLYSSSADGGKGFGVEIPSRMLPENVSYVSASTDTSGAWLVRRQNHAIAKLGDVSDITGPHAEFIISKDLVISTENDHLSSGNYKSNLSYYLNIYNEDDDSDTTLGDIRLGVQAENITGAGWGQYGVWNSTSVNWTFPPDQVIRENEGFGAGFGTDNSGSRYLGINVSRWMNRTNFTGEGYQLARFKVTFLNMDFQGIWGKINAQDLSGVEASIVPGTFTSDAPLNGKEEKMHEVNFNINKGGIQTGVQYNFSIIIRVNNTRNSYVQFKPEFTIAEELSFNATSGGEGYSVEIPSSMLPSNVSRVSATVNISNAWRVGQKYQHIAHLTGDRSSPVIIDFKVEPNISVSGGNPAIASAYVSDVGLQNVAFGIIDSGDLINKNSTVLGFFVNESGINGKYVAPPWYAKSWSLTNGSMNETVTIIDHADLQKYLFAKGMFRKNAMSIEEEAVLWFNRSTGILVNITATGTTLTPLQIEDGNSTFRTSISRFKDGLNKSPVDIPGRTFDLYLPENPENPYITMTSVPSGIYKMFVHAVDISGNENGGFVDVGVGQGIPPVANCGPDKLKCENVNSSVQFNASSYDPDGSIVSYEWEFGDGAAGIAPKHSYTMYRWNGTAYHPFIVNLTVTDNDGLTNSTSQKTVIWIAGDSNGDGKVNILDASIIGLKWNGNDSCGDLNNDGKVNILDAALIGLNWGKEAIKNYDS